MNKQQLKTHCSSENIELFLRGTLSSSETEILELHLTECESCALQIQLAAEQGVSWHEAQSLLAADEYDSPQHFAAISSLLSDEHDPMTKHQTTDVVSREIRGWLDPTDDPRSMGRFAGYEIVGIVGHGGMGIVLKGFEASLNRYVAIKILAPRLATNGSARKRFAREAQAAAAVRHDNVIAIHRVDEWHSLPFLVMPYAGGISLQKRIDSEGPLSIQQTLRVGVQIASGLAAAHAQGLIHRDIKPANILLEQGVERVTITDFGLARAADDASVTRTGVIAGTPQYMSPEQAEAKQLDARSDLFSLGSVLYAMATGRPPFRGAGSFEVLNRIVHEPARPMREIEASVPEWFENIVNRFHSKSPNDRPSSASEVAELLEECLAHMQQPTTTPLPESIATLAPKQSRHRPIGKFIAATAFAFSLIFAGVLIMLELNKGTLTIECDADDVPVRIMQGDKVVEKMTVSKSAKYLRIAAGNYVVELDGDFQWVNIKDGKVSLARRGVATVEISRNAKLVLSSHFQPGNLDGLRFGERHERDEGMDLSGYWNPEVAEPGETKKTFESFPTLGNGIEEVGLIVNVEPPHKLTEPSNMQSFLVRASGIRRIKNYSACEARVEGKLFFTPDDTPYTVGYFQLQLDGEAKENVAVDMMAGSAHVNIGYVVGLPNEQVRKILKLNVSNGHSESWLSLSLPMRPQSAWASHLMKLDGWEKDDSRGVPNMVQREVTLKSGETQTVCIEPADDRTTVREIADDATVPGTSGRPTETDTASVTIQADSELGVIQLKGSSAGVKAAQEALSRWKTPEPIRAEQSEASGGDGVGQLLSEIGFLNKHEEHGANSARSVRYGADVMRLTNLGAAAVPSIIEELDRTDDPRMIATLAFVLRAIGDKRGVPALIRAIPRTHVAIDDCNWIHSTKAIDKELIGFFRQHKFKEQGDAAIGCSNAEVELGMAFSSLTGGWETLSRTSTYGRGTPIQIYLQKKLLHRDAERLGSWWEQHSSSMVNDVAYLKAGVPEFQLNSPGIVAPNQMLATIAGEIGYYLKSLRSATATNDRYVTAFLDLDTGRISPLPEQWRDKQLSEADIANLLVWAENEGFDLTCDQYKAESGKSHFVLRGIGLKAWQLDEKSRKDDVLCTWGEIAKAGRIVTGDCLVPFDKTEGVLDPTGTAPFLVVTREGSPVLVHVGGEATVDSGRGGGFSSFDSVNTHVVAAKGRMLEIQLFDAVPSEQVHQVEDFHGANPLLKQPQSLDPSVPHAQNVPANGEEEPQPASDVESASPWAQVGDVIEVSVQWSIRTDAKVTFHTRVADDGTVRLAVLGQISVAGLMVDEIDQAICDLITRHNLFISPTVLSRIVESADSKPLARIRSGDVLEVFLRAGFGREDSMTIMSRVARDGTVTIPDLGQVSVVGLTFSEAEIAVFNQATSKRVLKHPSVFISLAKAAKADVIETNNISKTDLHDEDDSFAWQQTDPHVVPNFSSFFPDSKDGGLELDALWNAANKDSRSDAEILKTVRDGFRNSRQHRMPILRWIGNKYIWNKSPQNPHAIEIMYHAADFSGEDANPSGARHAAVYFGLSVTQPKTSAILRTLAELSMRVDDPNDLDRIAWGCSNQKEELLEYLKPFDASDDEAIRSKADVCHKIFSGELKAFGWAAEQARQRAEKTYSSQLPQFKVVLTSGSSEERLKALQTILAQRIALIMDDSFVAAFAKCAEDKDRQVRVQTTIIAGANWVWEAQEQNPEAIQLMLKLSKDDVRDVRYNAVYYGLSTVRNKSDDVIRRLLEMAFEDREWNLFNRIEWGLRDDRERVATMLTEYINEENAAYSSAAREVFKQLTGREVP
ncbi:MAG: protein kinase [Planctomycetaceae bacterium]